MIILLSASLIGRSATNQAGVRYIISLSEHTVVSCSSKLCIPFFSDYSFGDHYNSNIYLTEIMYKRYSIRLIVKLSYIVNIYGGLMLEIGHLITDDNTYQ